MKRHSLTLLASGMILLTMAALLLVRKKNVELPSAELVVQKNLESTTPLPTTARTYKPIALPAEASERDKKVVSSLNKFVEQTAGITAESIAEERERVKEGLKNSLEKPTAIPKSTLVTDTNGEKWEKLEFNDGIVRYVPVAPSDSHKD